MQSNSGVSVYWEKQGTDRLCAVHCINSLLQGPFYNELSLAEIARELDSQEKELLMGQGTESKDFLNYLAEGSNNVADDGNYNIQVISESLKRVGDLKCISIDSADVKNKDLSAETGFICNSSAHWLTIRKINGKWYNLNSTNREGPEMISDFYLSAFLNSVRENGYIIFVVQGEYPQYDRSFFGETLAHQRWFTENQCEEMNKINLKRKNYKLNIGGTDERDLEEALQNSLKEAGGKGYQNNDNDDDDAYERAIQESMKDNDRMEEEEEDENKFKAFQGTGVSLASNIHHNDLESYFEKWISAEDPELAFAMKLSIADQFANKPQHNDDSLSLNIRLFTGTVENWVFNKNSIVEELYDFVKVKLPEDQLSVKFRISTSYPKKHLINFGDTLGALGIEDQDTLVTEKL